MAKQPTPLTDTPAYKLTNAIYLSGWEERKITLPVDTQSYEAGLKDRQEMEKAR